VKKCVQCTKDLPDAALHCVFCGSKQPAQAPAELARTVMGYSANEVRDQLAAQAPAASPRAHSPSAAPPMGQGGGQAGSFGNPQPAPQVPFNQAPSYRPPSPPQQDYQQQAYQPPAQQDYQQQPAYQPPAQQGYRPPSAPAFPPPVAANAATMFVPSASAPRPGNDLGVPAAPSQASTMAAPIPMVHNPGGYFGPSSQSGPQHPPQPQGGHGGHGGQGGYGSGGYNGGAPMSSPYVPPPPSSPYQPAPFVSPSAYPSGPQSPPYLASQTADRPIDPFRDGLRLVLFTFGILLLGAFCTPLSSAPSFHWSGLLGDGPFSAKLPSVLLAAVGAFAIIIASVPLPSAPRGLLAVGISLLGFLAPLVVAKSLGGQWQGLVLLFSPFLLIPGLLLRQEYRESLLPRLLVTLGVLATLALWLVPVGGKLPLVGVLQLVIDNAGTAKVTPLLQLVNLVLVVLSLLVWIPAPASAGAKLFAWILVFWPAVQHFQGLILSENLGEMIKQAPFAAVMAWAPPVAYLAIFGYGLAALIGKRLENA
jgi:hypothetical protein